jgi:hypothetical protein
MTKTIVHVNQHNIKFNSKHGNLKPVLTVKQGKKNTYTNEVTINGPSKVVYSPEKPLSCGARVWIETEAEVTVINPMTFQETKQICGVTNGKVN